MKNYYAVTVREILEKTIAVEAESLQDAINITDKAWRESDIVLGADEFSEVEFVPSEYVHNEDYECGVFNKDDERIKYYTKLNF